MIIQSINLKFISLLSRLFSVDIERSFQSDSASSSARTRTHKLSWSRAGTDRISEAKSAKVLGPRLKSMTSSISQRGLKSQKQTEYKNLNFYPLISCQSMKVEFWKKKILFGQFGLLKICWKHFTKWLNWKTTQIPTS